MGQSAKKQVGGHDLLPVVVSHVVSPNEFYVQSAAPAAQKQLKRCYYVCVCYLLYLLARSRLKFGTRALSVAAPRTWNRLQTELKLMRSTSVFKHSLKTFLVQTAYCIAGSRIAPLNWTV